LLNLKFLSGEFVVCVRTNARAVKGCGDVRPEELHSEIKNR
jgi:hypothetical protein